ncbi:Endoplasmin-like [Gracilariopsis chorda]|uniref:Endoplasmin-like n=1 Tax=Gracilariopsis chorda TaxID=448386 RepID=A0A2V3IE47_9FLOR|nr:Endoplasmin-like [Gracilariopsis chorda]|eukprot:PXF40343.1 Endoplasmin-like [Gracilariopsis chorda]
MAWRVFGLLVVLSALFAVSISDTSINIGNVESAKIQTEPLSAHPDAQKFQFQAEVNRLMDIIINSLYSNRDVFLRELISNASDALDKIRFLALSDSKLLGEGDAAKLEIKVRADKHAGTLEITDSGIGMTRDDLIKNLGTIAKSGTNAFLKKAAEAKDTSNLIGQFGVGFYSAYLVADHVTVTTKHNDDKQYVWESGAEQTFTIYEDKDGEPLLRGTRLTLHLKDDAQEYLDEAKLKDLIKRYSQFINFPIFFETTEVVEVQVEEDAEEGEQASSEEEKPKGDEETDTSEEKDEETDSDDEDIKVSDGDGEDDKKPKTKTEERKSWTLLNENKPIWTRDPNDISEEEYTSFYEGIAKLPGKPLARSHFKGEGDVEFRSILYIPDKPPVGLYSGTTEEEKEAIKLYVRRVLVTDKFEYALLPRYLGFLVGIVDSDDIPINVSREMLQQSKTLDIIKRKLIRKGLEMFRSLMKQDEEEVEKKEDEDEEKDGDEKAGKPKSKYIDFWNKYGKSIKLGVIEDTSNRGRIAKLLRFRTSKTNTDDPYDWASLDNYMDRMKKDQDHIYYHSGSDLASVQESPFLEKLLKKGYEVLYLTEPIDEHMIMNLPDYDGTKFMSISKDNFKFGEKDQEEEKTKSKALKKKFKPLTKFLKEKLGDKVSKVKISNRLSQSVCVLSTDQYGYSARMEIIMKAQAFADPDSFSYMTPKAKIMELNPHHPLVKEMLHMVADGGQDERAAELGHLVYDTALISSGYLIQDNAVFAKRMYKWIGESVGVDADEEVVEEYPEAEEGEDNKEENEEGDDSEEVSGEDLAAEFAKFEAEAARSDNEEAPAGDDSEEKDEL